MRFYVFLEILHEILRIFRDSTIYMRFYMFLEILQSRYMRFYVFLESLCSNIAC